MRISTQQQYLTSIDNMQRSQTNLAKLQEQIATGKKLLNPSDDPVAAAQVVKLERELAQYEKYEDNINVTERRLEMEDTILDDINTQDSEGECLFAGSKGSTKPYTELPNGRYEYNGDDGQRSIQVGSDLYLPSNDSGYYLFEAVEDSLTVGLTGLAVYNANLAATDPFMRNATFADKNAEEQFQTATKGLGDLTISVTEPAPGAFQYSIVDSGGNPVNDASGNPITNVPAGDLSTTPLDVNLFGMQFQLHEPADVINANQITINVSPETKNVLDIAVDLAEVLAKPIVSGNRDELSAAIATGLDQFEAAADRNLEARATVGSRLKNLEYVSSSNLDFKLLTESAISTLVDVDLANAISQFSLEEATLQASQATFGRVASLSLFDYIR